MTLLQNNLGDEWVVDFKGKGEKSGDIFNIYKSSWGGGDKLIFVFDFGENRFSDNGLGVMIRGDGDLVKKHIEDRFFDEVQGELDFKTSDFWLYYDRVNDFGADKDFSKYIILETNSKKYFVDRVLNMIDRFERDSGLLTKINKSLNP